jgi:hypothetical protein
MGYDVQQGIGEHDVIVESVELVDKDGDGSNLVVQVRVKFEDGETGNKDLYATKSPKSAAITRKSLKAMGFDVDTRSLDEIVANRTLLSGVRIRATVEENEYNGKITHRISWLNAIPKPPAKGALAKLSSALKNAKDSNAEEAL